MLRLIRRPRVNFDGQMQEVVDAELRAVLQVLDADDGTEGGRIKI